MAAFNKFDAFVEHLAEKTHNFSADTFKVLLTNTAPVAGNSVRADLVELGAGNGYTSGGNVATVSSSGQTGGVYKVVMADVVFTAVGGSIGPFRYAVPYNDTPISPADPLVGWWDYGASLTIAAGETFTVDFDPTNGVFTLA